MRKNGNGTLTIDWRVFSLIITVVAGSVAWAVSGASTRGRYEERIEHNTAAITELRQDLKEIKSSVQAIEVQTARMAAERGNHQRGPDYE